MSEATPRPWAMTTAEDVNGGIRSITIERRGPSGITVERIVARVEPLTGEGKASAALIVRAVNLHDDLVAACKMLLSRLLDVLSEPDRTIPPDNDPYTEPVVIAARAALARADS